MPQDLQPCGAPSSWGRCEVRKGTCGASRFILSCRDMMLLLLLYFLLVGKCLHSALREP